MDVRRYKKIKSIVDKLIAPSIRLIKRSRKRSSMPYRDIETILRIFFPKTRLEPTGKGFYKRVFVIHSHRRRLVLKIGRSKRHIRKDYTTYKRLPENVRNRHFAKIYWADGLFMLQKYGRADEGSPGRTGSLETYWRSVPTTRRERSERDEIRPRVQDCRR